MAALSEDVKTFIVRELAMYGTPTEIAKKVKEDFGVEVTRQHVHTYNPLAVQANPPAKKWRDLFDATRQSFLADTSSIGIAQRSYRLKQLDEMAAVARSRGNHALAAQLMEQAAKECGDAYTNRLRLSGVVGHQEFSPDDDKARSAALDSELDGLIGVGPK